MPLVDYNQKGGTVEARVIGFEHRGNLGVAQIATADQDTIEYITSGKAIKEGLLTVTEVSEAGNVNEIIAINQSDHLIFFMDGDILSGAKQNRILNTSVLLAPRSKTRIPVSCVEQGRWSRTSRDFSGTSYSAPTTLRAGKAVRVVQHLSADGRHATDQNEVWRNVVLFQEALHVKSDTSSLSDVYDQRRAQIEKFLEGFQVADGANGAAIFLGNEIVSLDIFNKRIVLKEYLPKLLRGVALDSLHEKPIECSLGEAEGSYRTIELLDHMNAVNAVAFPAVGVGEERRFELEEFVGFELHLDRKSVHATALRVNQGARRRP